MTQAYVWGVEFLIKQFTLWWFCMYDTAWSLFCKSAFAADKLYFSAANVSLLPLKHQPFTLDFDAKKCFPLLLKKHFCV